MGRAESAAPRLDPGAGDVEELQHELLPVPAPDPGRDRSAAPARLARIAEALPAEDGRGPLDRDDEPDRAAGRIRSVARAYEGGKARGSLLDLRAEDLHHLRRA